jgi:hypothetical protein
MRCWKPTIDEAADYEKRNRKRASRWSTLRELTDRRAIDTLPQRLGPGFDLIIRRLANIVDRILRLFHSVFLFIDGLRDELWLDAFRRELESALLEGLSRKIAGARFGDCCENFRRNVCGKNFAQTR